MEFDIDLRLGADIWLKASDVDAWNAGLIAALVRFAYGRGYHDALTEPQRGQLCREHGFPVPRRVGRS